MADNGSKSKPLPDEYVKHRPASPDEETVGAVQKYAYSDKRKIGITGAVFLILNKMIGTGSAYYP